MKRILKCSTLAVLLIIAFAVNGCMLNQNDLAGRINGKPISQSVYMDSYRAHYNNFQILNNRTPDKDEKDQIKLLTWRNATKHVILTSYFTKYGISCSQQEVIDTLKSSIPEYIYSSGKFIRNGVFDHKSYFQSLEYDTPENLMPLRQHYKDYLIPIQKLEKHLIRDEILTKAQKKLSTKILQTSADIDWVILDPQNVDPIVTEEDIQFYYQNHASQFKQDPVYSIGISRIDVIPSEEDKAYTKVLADTLYFELLNGITPETVLAKHSPQRPSLSFKNSGFLPIESIDPELYKAMAFLDEGAYLSPQSSDNGIAIYQLVQRTKSMVNFNTLLVPHSPSASSKNLRHPLCLRLSALASVTGLAKATDEMELSYDRAMKMQPTDLWNADTKLVDAVYSLIRSKPNGFVTEPVYSDEAQAWFVVEVLDNQLDAVKSLDEVRSYIADILIQEKRLSMTQYLATMILSGQGGISSNAIRLEATAMQYNTPINGVIVEKAFYKALKHHFQSERQEYLTIDNRIWIPFVVATQVNPKKTVPSEDILRIFSGDLDTDWFDKWMNKKIDKADIRIYMN